jgi:hypothetical protein
MIYNVLTGVCELTEADTPEQAIANVNAALSSAGFNVYSDDRTSDAFESDDQTEEPSLIATVEDSPDDDDDDELPVQDLRALLDWSRDRIYEHNPSDRPTFLTIQRLSDWLDDYPGRSS